jgi:NTP pyrophosphatase (non-canonical NTP hydrolase)
MLKKLFKPSINELAKQAHETALEKGFYSVDPSMFMEKLMLTVSELSEAAEAFRRGDTEHIGEELADAYIRLVDLAYYMDIDIEKEVLDKMNINKGRPWLHGKER